MKDYPRGLVVYDGGLGENPVPQPKCMIEELKKHADKKRIYIFYRNR